MEEFPVLIMDVDYPLLAIGIAWAAILGMLALGAAIELWRCIRPEERAPFFGMLDRFGLSLVQAEQVAGFAGVRDAAARCASCDARATCRRALRWDWLGFDAPPCPNAEFFARVTGRYGPGLTLHG